MERGLIARFAISPSSEVLILPGSCVVIVPSLLYCTMTCAFSRLDFDLPYVEDRNSERRKGESFVNGVYVALRVE